MSPFVSSQIETGSEEGSLYLQKRTVRLLLRGNRAVEGLLHMSEGQSLTTFLEMKKHFLNLTSVRWLDGRTDDEPLPHLSVRISQIVWVVPVDGTIPLSSAVSPLSEGRHVELDLVGDLKLQVVLSISGEQRMSDYFDSNTSFIPLRSARDLRTQEVMERLAVHHEAILTIREI